MNGVNFGQSPPIISTNKILSCSFTPDGGQIALGCNDALLEIWDIKSHTCIKSIITQEKTSLDDQIRISKIIFSSQNQKMAVLASLHSSITLWDTNNYTFFLKIQHDSIIHDICFLANQNKIACIGENHFTLFNTLTGQKEHCTSLDSPTYSLSSSSIGNIIAFPQINSINLFNVMNSEFLPPILSEIPMEMVRLHPHLNNILISSDGESITIFNLEDRAYSKIDSVHQKGLVDFNFSHNGKYIVSVGEERILKVWDIETKECIKMVSAHCYWKDMLAVSSTTHLVATAHMTNEVKLTDISLNIQQNPINVHSDFINSIIILSDKSNSITSGHDGSVLLWELNTGKCSILYKHKAAVNSIDLFRDEFILSAGRDNTIILYNLKSNTILQTLNQNNLHLSGQLTFLNNANNFLLSIFHTEMLFFDLLQRSKSSVTLRSRNNEIMRHLSVNCLCHIEKLHYIAIPSPGCAINILKYTLPAALKHTLIGHTKPICSIASSPSQQYLASASEDSTIKIWDLADGQCSFTLTGHESEVFVVSFMVSDTLVCSGSRDKTIKIWSLTSNGECIQTVSCFSARIRSLDVSSDGDYIVVGTEKSVACLKKDNGSAQYLLQWLSAPQFNSTNLTIEDVDDLSPQNIALLKSYGGLT